MENFNYTCTSEKLSIEQEYDDTLADEEHVKEEEILLLKELDSREEFYMLMASEPNYYLRLMEDEPDVKYLCEDYELFFIRESAKDGYRNNLRIKFKILPTDNYTEIGFFSEADDNATYSEFKTIATNLLKRVQSAGNKPEEARPDYLQYQFSEQSRDTQSSFEPPSFSKDMFEEKEDVFCSYQQTVPLDDAINVPLNNCYLRCEIEKLRYKLSHGKEATESAKTQDFYALENLREKCPKEFLTNYDKMLCNLLINKKSQQMPCKELVIGLMNIYKNTRDDAVKYEIDTFLFSSNYTGLTEKEHQLMTYL